MNTTIIALRHGETQWNKLGKQQGHLNSDLTDLGIRQAQAIADGVRHFKIDLIYSSDLGRAIQTSEIIARSIGKSFITDSRLRERRLGILQGLTKVEFTQRYPHEADRYNSNDPDYCIPEGESARQRYSRSITFIEELVVRHGGKTLLIVTHGGVLMSYMYKALNLPLNQKRTFSGYNGSLNCFNIDAEGQWLLQFWGDTSHLRMHGIAPY
ncbi:MAG: histidine phosphatase family protein [Chitinivibrionales bacterium]|nr:histidine phosphatase family protein [Chitinivibrionales bacterium]